MPIISIPLITKLVLTTLGLYLFISVSGLSVQLKAEDKPHSWWEFQAIDTMKYSRDLSRQKLNDSAFDEEIRTQLRDIADAGATHVAIGTPYDEEFVPFLARWVTVAREYDLKVWFRGNWSGWEEWFDYPRIGREDHIAKTKEFVLNHRDLFEDGDIFTACPECENGGPGDPRSTGDIRGHREFLIEEFQVTHEAFRVIHKKVISNYNSMNGDVARLIMDKPTTKSLGGVIVVDHYVGSPDRLVADVKEYARLSGGQVVLGEFGAPIPDIHGQMTDAQQAEWLQQALNKLSTVEELIGLNYWVNIGGSTELWPNGRPSSAVAVLKSYYKPNIVSGTVRDELGLPISGAEVRVGPKRARTNDKGQFQLPALDQIPLLSVSAPDHEPRQLRLYQNTEQVEIVLINNRPNWFFELGLRLRRWLNWDRLTGPN